MTDRQEPNPNARAYDLAIETSRRINDELPEHCHAIVILLVDGQVVLGEPHTCEIRVNTTLSPRVVYHVLMQIAQMYETSQISILKRE